MEAEYLVFDFDVDIISESTYYPIVNLCRKYDIGVLVKGKFSIYINHMV